MNPTFEVIVDGSLPSEPDPKAHTVETSVSDFIARGIAAQKAVDQIIAVLAANQQPKH